jgi:hypothetical protein
MELSFDGAVGLLMMVLVPVVVWRLLRRRTRVGPGAAGALHDMLNQDRRKAVEIIVEQRAEERRPENADGNLPDLEAPKRNPS